VELYHNQAWPHKVKTIILKANMSLHRDKAKLVKYSTRLNMACRLKDNTRHNKVLLRAKYNTHHNLDNKALLKAKYSTHHNRVNKVLLRAKFNTRHKVLLKANTHHNSPVNTRPLTVKLKVSQCTHLNPVNLVLLNQSTAINRKAVKVVSHCPYLHDSSLVKDKLLNPANKAMPRKVRYNTRHNSPVNKSLLKAKYTISNLAKVNRVKYLNSILLKARHRLKDNTRHNSPVNRSLLKVKCNTCRNNRANK
jgi:hypothetical protein